MNQSYDDKIVVMITVPVDALGVIGNGALSEIGAQIQIKGGTCTDRSLTLKLHTKITSLKLFFSRCSKLVCHKQLPKRQSDCRGNQRSIALSLTSIIENIALHDPSPQGYSTFQSLSQI